MATEVLRWGDNSLLPTIAILLYAESGTLKRKKEKNLAWRRLASIGRGGSGVCAWLLAPWEYGILETGFLETGF